MAEVGKCWGTMKTPAGMCGICPYPPEAMWRLLEEGGTMEGVESLDRFMPLLGERTSLADEGSAMRGDGIMLPCSARSSSGFLPPCCSLARLARI